MKTKKTTRKKTRLTPHRRISPELAALRLAQSVMPAEDLRLLLRTLRRSYPDKCPDK